MRRLPTFNVSNTQYARAIGVGVAAAIAIGMLWGFALTIPFVGGFFSLIIAGIAGYGIGESISQSVNRRQGRPLEIIAGVAVVFALLNAQVLPQLGKLLLAGAVPPPGLVIAAYASALIGTVTSIFGLVAILIGVVVAVSRFR